jgi:hypothetical protein
LLAGLGNTIRWHQLLLIGSTLLGSWLGMQAMHEFGHVCGAWLTGGQVARVILHPLTFSRTDMVHNPSPLLVVWAGPVVGVALPLLLWLAALAVRWRGAFVLRFFAGFCLLANGVYIGFGSFDRVGDCGVMLRHGSSLWHLWLFGALAAPLGMWLWHGLGADFGFGPARREVHRGVAYGTLVACVALVVMGLIA